MTEMTPCERLMTALGGGVPDRVPCSPAIIRWVRSHYGCTCPRHQLKMAADFGLDLSGGFDLGSPEAVRNAVQEAIADAARGGGYVLATAEAVDPMTSAECLHAAVQAAKECGRM